MPDAPPATIVGCVATQLPRKIHILLVDDHEDSLQLMRRVLTRYGYDVTAATSVRGALEAAAVSRTVDLLIADIELPDGTGLDLLRQMRARYPLKSIAVSGHAMDVELRQGGSNEFDCRLVKPVDFDRLNEAIRRATAATS